MNKPLLIAMAIGLVTLLGEVPAAAADPPASLLFAESFDDARLLDRGWYDSNRFDIVRKGAFAGDGCIAHHWSAGGTTPDNTSGVRRLFEPTERVYLRCYLRLSTGWGWSGRPYHPHLMHFMTTENGRWHGPAASHLTVYVEPCNGKLRLAAQDIQNADRPHGLTQGPLRGGYNGYFYDSAEELFRDDQWHCIEAMFQLNSLDLAADKPNADGIVRGWFDGRLVIDHTDAVLRSTDFPNMKFNHYLLAPYFGPGLLPHEQTLWVDELAVGTERLGPLPSKAQAAAPGGVAAADPQPKESVRVAAAQTRNRTFDFRLESSEVLAQLGRTLDALESIADRAGEAGCDALAFPEDTLGLLNWLVAERNANQVEAVLPEAVRQMLDRLGQVAAKHGMHIVVCSDSLELDGRIYNTSFLIGRDGKELGRYRKVNLPLSEQSRARGDRFPVFETPDLGTLGMLICYDMVFPEAARCLALAGADLVFVPTLGGAAFGDDDISRAAFRTRAADNFVWLVVAKRGAGSMIISPRGRIVAEATEADGLAMADIDPRGERDGGDAFNRQLDLRGRVFRERIPAAYGILTDPQPPVLDRIPSNVSQEEAIRIMSTVLTTGEQRFQEAAALARAGRTDEAIRVLEQLCIECPTSWIERSARQRLQVLRSQADR